MIPGRIGFLAQLNEGRALKKRPTEFRVDLVKQDFDPSKFNFTKAAQKEALFQLDTASATRTYLRDAKVLDDSPHLVVINVSPIEYGHVLLVPRVLDNLPQQVRTCFENVLQNVLSRFVEVENGFTLDTS
jgi:GDP-L-galactose phosphorylase